ncbi:MAG: hypothetical protein SNJ64_01870 [Endomicrobiia bacterium]
MLIVDFNNQKIFFNFGDIKESDMNKVVENCFDFIRLNIKESQIPNFIIALQKNSSPISSKIIELILMHYEKLIYNKYFESPAVSPIEVFRGSN